MLKGEIEILIAVALNKKQIVSSQLALKSPFITSTIDSLIKQGYLTYSKTQGYRLTDKGADACLENLPVEGDLFEIARSRLLNEHSSQARDAVKKIEQLGVEYEFRLGELHN